MRSDNNPDVNLPELARNVAQQLGGELLEAHESYSTISTRHGFPIALSYSRYDGRLRVSPWWPSYRDDSGNSQRVLGRDVLPYDQRNGAGPTLEISCNPTRPSAAIAADIARRLVPDALPVYAKTLEACEKNAQLVRDKAAMAGRFARYGYTRSTNGDGAALYGPSELPHLEMCYDGEIAFSRLRCDEQTACAILDLLKARATDAGEVSLAVYELIKDRPAEVQP